MRRRDSNSRVGAGVEGAWPNANSKFMGLWVTEVGDVTRSLSLCRLGMVFPYHSWLWWSFQYLFVWLLLSESHSRSSCRSQLRILPPVHASLPYPVLLREMEGADGNTMQNSAGQVG